MYLEKMYDELDLCKNEVRFIANDVTSGTNAPCWHESPNHTHALPDSNKLWDYQNDAHTLSCSEDAFLDSILSDFTPVSEYLSEPASARRPDAAFSSLYDTDTLRWQALLSRSRRADSYFLYGVLSTKIYCRASCPSRRPISPNRVTYFPFPNAIESAECRGFRACKRCTPKNLLETSNVKEEVEKSQKGVGRAAIMVWEQAVRGEIDTIDLLAKKVHLSMWHFHRQFKIVTGLTPSNYARACFALAVQDSLGTCDGEFDQVDRQKPTGAAMRSLRRKQQVLGGLNPEEYSAGARDRQLFFTTSETAYGRVCVLWSFGAIDGGRERRSNFPIRLHALKIGCKSQNQIQRQFPWSVYSSDLQEVVVLSVQELDTISKERELELPKSAIQIVRRAKLWTNLSRCRESFS